jgi:hypothetical protein
VELVRIATRTVAPAASRWGVVVLSVLTFLAFALAGVMAAVADAAETPLFGAPVLVRNGLGPGGVV